jgi:protein-S-isoprenylcysteine O-methyltransferase Ste14
MRLFAWSGGVLFVAALARTIWLYVGELGRVRPFTGARAVLFDLLLFTIFAAHHSLFARAAPKRAVQALVPERAIRPFYVWVASALLILVCQLWREVGGELYAAPAPLAAALASVQIAGLVLTALGVRAIDPLELAGIRPPAARADDLVVGGAYRFVRHPLYLGWMLMVCGAPHMTGDRLVFALVTSAYLLVAIPWEERSLEAAFGNAYREYKRQVRWRVLPYVY